MSKQYVDRSQPLKGVNRTSKDVRLPANVLRAVENFRLPDGRLERRPGFENISEQTQIHGNQLAKHTASVVEYEQVDEAGRKIKRVKSPLSYGLIRWHDDFQPKSTQSWSVEFLVTLGDIEVLSEANDNYRNESQGVYGPSVVRLYLRPTRGAVLFDQTVISNKFTFKYEAWAGTETPKNAIAGASPAYCDVFAVSALSISVDTGGFYVQICPINAGNVYFPYDYNIYMPFSGLESWGSKTHHVCVTYDSATRQLWAYLNGALRGGYALPVGYKFAGEADAINLNTTVVHRDIVLLNECTARGGYSSTCRINASVIGGSGIVAADHGYYTLPHYYKSNATANATLIPWCHSPSRGTGMSELRIWHKAKTSAEITNEMLTEVDATDTDLVGYWKLDDGGPVCLSARENDYRYCTVHHGVPGYVADSGLVNGVGLVLADGQCLRNEYARTDYLYVRDSHIALRNLFTTDISTNYTARQDFVIQMQIRTPAEWQQELNTFSGSGTVSSTSGDTRQITSIAAYLPQDGRSTARNVREDTGATPTSLRAFDSTLFSVEGTVDGSISQADSLSDKRRVGLARGLLTPSGKVAFEYYGYGDLVGTAPRLYRIVTATTLDKNKVYAITFDRRTVYSQDVSGGGNTGKVVASGVALSIYLNNSTTADVTYTITGVPATPMEVDFVSDVLIGASQFADSNDRSITNTVSQQELAQRFMSPYQDQPGFFTLGYFRMWAGSVSISSTALYASSSLAGSDIYGKSLLYNIEVDAASQDQISSKTPFSDTFQIYFKGWGEVELQGVMGTRTAHPGAWHMEDRLGYIAKSPDFEGVTEAECKGLMSYSSTLRQTRGLLAVFDGSAFYNTTINGGLSPLLMTSKGLLNDFRPNGFWRGTSIGDRTILTSVNGFPKVFTGGTFSYLGFPRWTGGVPQIDTLTIAGSLAQNKWYGVRYVYVSEQWGLRQFSPAAAVSTGTTNLQLTLRNIPAHPDPRISAIYVYITQGQDTKDAALQGVYYPILKTGSVTPGATFENKFVSSYIYDTENLVTTAPLDLTFTPPPNCPYSASLNGRLYLAGGIVPDALYWSDAGSPENFNTAVNSLIIDEATGDRINGLVALFATLYVFKANSIWRVSEVAPGQHQMEKVADVGSISDRSVAIITMPDTGRTGIVFWSRFGPYLFDGINLQYLGYELEGEDEPYAWMDPDSVHVAHDVVRRELIFLYKSSGTNGTSDYYDRAVVYNYRFGSWVDYKGLSFSAALSTTFVTTTTNPFDGFTQNYKLLLGGTNGHVYEWATQDTDGVPSTLAETKYLVGSYPTTGQLGLADAGLIENHTLRGLWITIVKEDQSKWMTLRVIDNESGYLTLDLSYELATWAFAAGDVVYLGRPIAYAEFPWDSLEVPQKDKNVVRLSTWNKEEFMFNFVTDWRTSFDEDWRTLDDVGSSRQHTGVMAGNCEVFKLFFASVATRARMLNYGYEIEFAGEANNPQR